MVVLKNVHANEAVGNFYPCVVDFFSAIMFFWGDLNGKLRNGTAVAKGGANF